jgi:BRCT domain type II-containing protein
MQQSENATGQPTGKFSGKRFVLTSFRGAGVIDKDAVKKMVVDAGGTVTNVISGKTNFVIVGDEKPGPKKMQTARDKNITIVNLEYFKDLHNEECMDVVSA